MMHRLQNPVRGSAWGSLHAIPRLLGVEPDGRPQAELWLGAHERAASRLLDAVDQTSLLDLVRQDPLRQLGPDWAAGGRMPFLAKVIATAAPLSLQVHPDAERAARWFAEEEDRGIGPDMDVRSCPDDVAKVEMVWALSRFRALCGFRSSDENVEWLQALDVAALKPTAEALRRRGAEALRAETARLLRLDAPTDTVAAVRARAGVLEGDPRWDASAAAAVELATRYPADPAVALALLLRPVVLAPGEAMFVRTGQPHSYLSGTAFEVQANSDNVLRAGLTGKHVDTDRLLEALDTTGTGVAGVSGSRQGEEEVFAPGTHRFALGVLRRPAGSEPLARVPGPQVFFCVEGEFWLDDGVQRLRLRRGQSAYVPAATGDLRARGTGVLLRVTTGRAGSVLPPGQPTHGRPHEPIP